MGYGFEHNYKTEAECGSCGCSYYLQNTREYLCNACRNEEKEWLRQRIKELEKINKELIIKLKQKSKKKKN